MKQPEEQHVEQEDKPGDELGDKPLPRSYTYVPIPRNAFDAEFLDDCMTGDSDESESRPLFGDFWLEDDLCILFADTGKGKSILAVQIADSIARGVPIPPFDLSVPAQKVLYFDFEMSRKSIRKRYSHREEGVITDRYRFSRNIIRLQFNEDRDFPAHYINYEHFIHDSFEELVRESGARVVIIDNFTFLNSSTNTSGAKAFLLMNELQRLKGEYKLSILAIAHTPKRRPGHALTINDLHGSKMLSNLADNVFALGESCKGKDIRYLKHLKPRNSEMIYDASNVCVFRIRKRDNFLGFNFIGYSTEREHILPAFPKPKDPEAPPDKDSNASLENGSKPALKRARDLLVGEVKEMSAEGYTQRQIAAHLTISIATVNRYLRKPARK